MVFWRIILIISLCLVIIKAESEITGKWVWNSYSGHFLLNKENSKLWEEYYDNNVVRNYTVQESSNDLLILFDQSIKVYAKVTKKKIERNKDLAKLKQGKFTSSSRGKWLIKPQSIGSTTQAPVPSTTIKPNNDITGKWVWSNNPNHYVMNRKNSEIWEEYLDEKKPTKYTFWEFTEDNGVILYSDLNDVYVKLTDDRILYSDDIWLLKFISIWWLDGWSSGRWEVKPKELIPPNNEINAKWVKSGKPNEYFINRRGSDYWEFHQRFDKRPVRYTLFEFTDEGPILRSKKGNRFVHLTNRLVKYADSLSDLKEDTFTSVEFGRWEVKPKKPLDSTTHEFEQFTTECPNKVMCLRNPCESKTCPNYPNAKCRPNYCGGCKYDFYLNGQIIKRSSCYWF